MPEGPRYDDDFFAWTQHQAAVLRSLPVADNRFDRENVAEEIEALGRSERDTVRSQVRRILEHLLKLEHSPAQAPRFGWMGSIVDARAALLDRITESLRQDLREVLPRLCRSARRRAELSLKQAHEPEAASALPSDCPYTLDQILDDDWLPEKTEGAK